MFASLITFTLELHSLPNFFNHHVPDTEDVYSFLLNVSMVSYLSFSVGSPCFSFHTTSLWALTIGMSQNANHEGGALRSVTQTLWYPPKGCCTPAWTVQGYAVQSGPLQGASRTSSPKMSRKSKEYGNAGKSCVFKKITVMSWGFPYVRANKFSSGVTQDRVQCWGALGHPEQSGWVQAFVEEGWPQN